MEGEDVRYIILNDNFESRYLQAYAFLLIFNRNIYLYILYINDLFMFTSNFDLVNYVDDNTPYETIL